MYRKIGNTITLLFDIRGYFEISVFGICESIELHLHGIIMSNYLSIGHTTSK